MNSKFPLFRRAGDKLPFCALLASLFLSSLISQVCAAPVPQNLGGGLRDIVEKELSAKQAAPGAATAPSTPQRPSVISYDKLKITDAQKRILVNIVLKGTVPLSNVEGQITALGSNVVARNPRYRAGVIEAFVSPEQAVEIAKMEGVAALHLVPKPMTNIGIATTQGIVQHRIDKLPAGIDGTGITVGVLSDSYNAYALYGVHPTAKDDIASGDLPGPGNPFGHRQRVDILQDAFGNDEGRAMLQIVQDIAPEARLGFATAFAGEVSFADNIRSLAGLPTGSLAKHNFKADVIIDDVIYFDEPMFQDGMVAQAVDDVAAAGVAYFSSAGNIPPSNAYDAAFRLVPSSTAAAAGSNLDFTGVDPVLYEGGFHNFASGAAQDIAQTIHIDQWGIISFQWNEPFDASGAQLVQTDFNLLFFDANGKFIGAAAENNLVTGRPIELAQVSGTFDVQMVIARANTPPPGILAADHLRYVWFGGGQPREFVDYTTPATFGHSSATGANSVAAYAFYPPFIPESFTSSGPVTIYFDKDNNPLPQPDLRLKPDMAAMDGANTTFFVQDASQDRDSLPNFFGTSASAPHAGGIAALMLQAAGGSHALSPDAVRQALQASAFLHDLDPNRAQGSAQRGRDAVVVSVDGDRTLTSSIDPNSFTVTYSGPNSLTSLTLNLSNANTTERPTPGLVFDPNEGTGFLFTLGNVTGVPSSAITTAFTAPAPPPATSSQYRELTVSIKPGAMNNGDVLRFGVDRDEADAFGPLGAVGVNSPDLFGAGVLIPQGTIAPGGATWSATLSDGSTLQGVFMNNIGQGYSTLDGFGFVNAQAAVQAVQKP